MATRSEKIDNLLRGAAEALRTIGSLVVVPMWFWLAIADHGLPILDILTIAAGSCMFCMLCFLLAMLLETFTND